MAHALKSWRRGARTIEPGGTPGIAALALLLGAISGGCDRPAVGASSGTERPATGTASVKAARPMGSLPVVTSTGSARPSAGALPGLPPISSEPTLHHGIAWYRDAPVAALARAQQEKKPLVVDLWASWCHTCLSMQAFVLTDAMLPGVRDRFVFLAIDTERGENAEFLQRFSATVWPTFYVLDAEGPTVRGRWLGAASPAEFVRFLDEGERAVELGRKGGFAADDPRAALANGDRLAAEKRFEAAAEEYGRALARAGKNWPRRSSTLVAQIAALAKARAYSACAELALSAGSDTGSGVNAADFAAFALSCAGNLAKGDARINAVRRRAEQRLTPLCRLPPRRSGQPAAPVSAELTPDDRADACGNLRAARTELGDERGAKRAAEIGVAIVEAASRDLPDDVALTYDRAHGDFLSFLGRSEEALSRLAARERALPDNYNPPHLLARVYRNLGRWDDGIAAIDRALARAYGPRRINLMTLKVELLLAAARKDEAIALLAEQIAAYRMLPAGQKQDDAEQNAIARLASLK
jgi:thiol-disulfide isomerase/thioredoxin